MQFKQGNVKPPDVPLQVDARDVNDSSLNQWMESLANELNTKILNCVASLEATIVQSVTQNISTEYNRVSIKCIASKGELKRSIASIRAELTTSLLGLESRLSKLQESSAANASQQTVNFDDLQNFKSTVQSKICSLDNRVTELASSIRMEEATQKLNHLQARTDKLEQLNSLPNELSELQSKYTQLVLRLQSLEASSTKPSSHAVQQPMPKASMNVVVDGSHLPRHSDDIDMTIKMKNRHIST